MKKTAEFPNTIIGVTADGSRVLLMGDQELAKYFDGHLFEDNCVSDKLPTFPTEPGVYRATVEYYFEQGYCDGSKADGESEWDYRLRDVVRVEMEATSDEYNRKAIEGLDQIARLGALVREHYEAYVRERERADAAECGLVRCQGVLNELNQWNQKSNDRGRGWWALKSLMQDNVNASLSSTVGADTLAMVEAARRWLNSVNERASMDIAVKTDEYLCQCDKIKVNEQKLVEAIVHMDTPRRVAKAEEIPNP